MLSAGYAGSFMMTRRIAWKCLAFPGKDFVKKSAWLSAVRTKGTVISCDSTMSRMKNVLHAVVVLRTMTEHEDGKGSDQGIYPKSHRLVT